MTERDQFYNDDTYFYAESFEWTDEITELNSFTNEDTRAQKRKFGSINLFLTSNQ